MDSWLDKMKESVAYMSDIITTIKDQAANVSANEDAIFNIEDVLKRCRLLVRHELVRAQSTLRMEYDRGEDIFIQGDMTSLVQVLVNLLTNAADAQKETGGGEIVLKIEHDRDELRLLVVDQGPGVSEEVRNKLFKSMVTTKGAQGTGIGLYISNTVIKGKFDGVMWNRANAGGGETFGVTIPMKRVKVIS